MLSNASSDFELIVRQQPERARVAGGKEKGTCNSLILVGLARDAKDHRRVERKPVDPPPVVQLKVREENTYLAQ
jgi:hypothetical protein